MYGLLGDLVSTSCIIPIWLLLPLGALSDKLPLITPFVIIIPFYCILAYDLFIFLIIFTVYPLPTSTSSSSSSSNPSLPFLKTDLDLSGFCNTIPGSLSFCICSLDADFIGKPDTLGTVDREE